MTDPEAKAREIVQWFDDFVLETRDAQPHIHAAYLRNKIATVLREARNAALEEAAKVAENHQNHAMGMPQHAASLEIATRIRALKDTTP